MCRSFVSRRFRLWQITRRSEPPGNQLGKSLTRLPRVAIIAAISAIALAGAVIRLLVGTEFLTSRLANSKSAGEALTTFIALLWWQLVVWGLMRSRWQIFSGQQ
jgi:hypothetical protein